MTTATFPAEPGRATSHPAPRGDAPADEGRKLVLAAVDTADAARPVLETARRVAEMAGSAMEVVHVDEDGRPEGTGRPGALEDLVRRAGAPFRRLVGPVDETLLDAVDAPGVTAAVVGARTAPEGRRPVGRTARHLLRHTARPVVVVPPTAVPTGPVRCVLLPMEGTASSSEPVLQALLPLLAPDVDLVVLHVFTDRTLPRMLDRSPRDLELLGREFLATHCPPAARIDLRPGPVASTVAEAAERHGADLVVLSWAQDDSDGRARVVGDVLAASDLPVLMLPAGARRVDHRPYRGPGPPAHRG